MSTWDSNYIKPIPIILYLLNCVGRSDCPYYAKVELLADRLANSVNCCDVHKIVKTPEEWEVEILMVH